MCSIKSSNLTSTRLEIVTSQLPFINTVGNAIVKNPGVFSSFNGSPWFLSQLVAADCPPSAFSEMLTSEPTMVLNSLFNSFCASFGSVGHAIPDVVVLSSNSSSSR